MASRVVHYQAKDANVVDYRIYFRHDCDIGFRGPRVPDHLNTRFGVALGSAAVFGRFAHQPFAEQLTISGFPTVNLGVSGARPQVFDAIDELPVLLRKAAFTIIEFMSARGYPLEFFTKDRPAANMGVYTPPGTAQSPSPESERLFVDRAWSRALEDYPPARINEFISVSRANYVAGMKRLIDQVAGDLVLLWFSQRPPTYQAKLDSFTAASGGFPHFIDAEMVDELMSYARASKGERLRYVELVSSQGLPMLLTNRFSGRPEPVLSAGPGGSRNTYYPSQEMHDEAAIKLLAALHDLRERGVEQVRAGS